MLYLDFEGKTEKEAVQLALDTLGLEKEDIKVEVLEKGSTGLLGIGKQVNAKVRIYYQEKNDVIDLVDKIKYMIERIDNSVYFEVNYTKDSRYIINVDSTNPGRLIGKNGQNLKAIQNIVNAMLRKYNNKYKILIDVSAYSKKQNFRFVKDAKEMALRVKETGKEESLGKINPFLRRLIHLEVQQIEGIKSYSKGEGSKKELFITLE